MDDQEFHKEADKLAIEIEETIAQTDEFLEQLTDFKSRSDRSKAFQSEFSNTDG